MGRFIVTSQLNDVNLARLISLIVCVFVSQHYRNEIRNAVLFSFPSDSEGYNGVILKVDSNLCLNCTLTEFNGPKVSV